VIAAEVDPGGGTGTEFRATGKSLDIFPSRAIKPSNTE
jgi:hypothetical protein